MTLKQESQIGRIDTYIQHLFVERDELLDGIGPELEAAGLPRIQVPSQLGKLLGLLVRISGAHRILEIGTLGGYSATWMARALPEDGRIVSLEKALNHAEFARRFLDRAGVGRKVEIIVGPALQTLPPLLDREDPGFDMVFIDADKEGYPAYLDWSLRLTRPGGLIIADNVLRGGGVIQPGDDPTLQAVDEFNRHAATSPLLDSLILSNRGGEDGILIATVKRESGAQNR